MSDARREARDARFDVAIDRAVREMLDVEPRADLRARVLEQLPAFAEATAGKPASGSRLPAFRSPFESVASAFRRNLVWIPLGVGAAAVVLAIVLAWRADAPIQPPTLVRGTDQNLPVPAGPVTTPPTAARRETAGALARPRPGEGGRAASPRVPAAVERGLVVATSADDPGSTNIEPLQRLTPMHSLAPIEVAPVAQRNIAVADLAMRPLNPIAEMQIAPLNPPDRRN